jgi:DNA-binding MarR family transcriptional regulator
MFNVQDSIVIILLLIGLFIILTKELKTILKKRSETKNTLNHKIIAVLIWHGGKMNCLKISKYLDLPKETIVARIKEMEKKGVISTKEDEHDNICLKIINL